MMMTAYPSGYAAYHNSVMHNVKKKLNSYLLPKY